MRHNNTISVPELIFNRESCLGLHDVGGKLSPLGGKTSKRETFYEQLEIIKKVRYLSQEWPEI